MKHNIPCLHVANTLVRIYTKQNKQLHILKYVAYWTVIKSGQGESGGWEQQDF